MNLDQLFEYIVPLIIFAIFVLRGLFGNRPDPIDSFEPPPVEHKDLVTQRKESFAVPESRDEVRSRPQRLDTSSFRKQRAEKALKNEVREIPPSAGPGPQPLSQLRAQAAKANRARTQPEVSAGGEVRDIQLDLLSAKNIRRSARQIFFLKELLDRPLSLRPPSNGPY